MKKNFVFYLFIIGISLINADKKKHGHGHGHGHKPTTSKPQNEHTKGVVKGWIDCLHAKNLKKNSIVEIHVGDFRIKDVGLRSLGKATIKNPKKFPIYFKVDFNKQPIIEDFTNSSKFGIVVSIHRGNQLDYGTMSHTELIENEKILENVNVHVEKIQKPELKKIRGTINYQKDYKLESNLIARVTLSDTSKKDAPAVQLSEVIIKNPTKFPFNYEIPFNFVEELANPDYVLRVSIEKNGQLKFTTDTIYSILKNNKLVDKLDIKVVKVNENQNDKPNKKTISGFINFSPNNEKKIDPNIIIILTLYDTRYADAPATKIGEEIIQNPLKFPIPFSFKSFESSKIESDLAGRYGLNVRLVRNEKLAYINDQHFPILKSGKVVEKLNLTVIQVDLNDDQINTKTIEGQIDFASDSKYLPHGTTVYVSVLDVSKADAPSKKLGEQILKNPLRFPIKFKVNYDTGNKTMVEFIRGRFDLSVKIEKQNKLIYSTDTINSIIDSKTNKLLEKMNVNVVKVNQFPINDDSENDYHDDEDEDNDSEQHDHSDKDKRKLNGLINFSGSKTLKPDSVVKIVVEDISKIDVPSITLGKNIIKNPKFFPIEYEVKYNSTVMDYLKKGVLNVRVSIERNSKLEFTTDTRASPIKDNKFLDTLNLNVVEVPEYSIGPNQFSDFTANEAQKYDFKNISESSLKSLSGVLTYDTKSKIDLSNSLIKIFIEKTDATGTYTELATETIENAAVFPIPFLIDFDKKQVLDTKSGQYNLRVVIKNKKTSAVEFMNNGIVSILDANRKIVEFIEIKLIKI